MQERKKQAYIEKGKAKLKRFDSQIMKLEAIMLETKADARLKQQDMIDNVKEKRNGVSEKLEDLKQSGAESWKELKASIKGAIKDLKLTIKQTPLELKKGQKQSNV